MSSGSAPRDLHDRVGADGSGTIVVESFGRPVVVEAFAFSAQPGRRVDRRFAAPGEEVVAQGAAVGEDPGVELDVVEDAAVVEDRAAAVSLSLWDVAGVLEQAMTFLAEVVCPGK